MTYFITEDPAVLCGVHYHGMGAYYREGERRAYCQAPVMAGGVCAYHWHRTDEGCRCDLEEKARFGRYGRGA